MTSPHLAKHTKGPWHVSEKAMKPIIYDADGWAIADARTFHGKHGDDEAIANANLIAAAPDLLAALCEYMIMGVGKCTIGKATADKALAAINKATGRA